MSMKSDEKKVVDFRDEAGLSTRRLDIGLWYVRHRRFFVIIGIAILALTAASTVGYSLYKFSDYIFVGRQQEQQNFLELTSGGSLITNRSNTGNNLSYSDVKILSGINDQSDILAAVTNSNTRSLINFSYYFNVNGEKVGGSNDFIFPGDTKYVMAIGVKLSAPNPTATLVIGNISYSRLDRRAIGDWDQYRSSHINFLIEQAAFVPASDSGLSEKVSLGELTFHITNQSAFGYKNVPLSILLKSGGNIIAINRYQLNDFRSGEARNVRLTWPGKYSGIDQVEITPDLNILDEDVYLKYSSL